MEQLVFLQQIEKLSNAFREVFTDDQIDIWWDFFKKTDESVFKKAVTRSIEKCNRLPSIAEIKSLVSSEWGESKLCPTKI